jgi:GNAT superfamily N-acetyltransferase
MSAMALRCERAGQVHAARLLQLFEEAGTGCYCNYWHFAGDKNAWLERCYLAPEQNRRALEHRLAARELQGVVALVPAESAMALAPAESVAALAPAESGEEKLIGWLKVARALSTPKLYDQRVYRNLPIFGAAKARENVFALSCFFVAEGRRERGVARALLHCAIAEARATGASAIEAFPRGVPAGERLRGDQLNMGPLELFLGAGFEVVSDSVPYPVLRLALS